VRLGDRVRAEVEDRGASTALAWPSVTPSTRCSSVPTPPLATTGTDTASAIVAGQLEVVAALGPVAVHRGDQQLAGAELGQPHRVLDRVDPGRRRPPWVKISQWSWLHAASTEATTHWLPNLSGDLGHDLGRATAAELTATLSAPGEQQARASSTARTPAADGQRHEAHLRGAADTVEQRPAPFVAAPRCRGSTARRPPPHRRRAACSTGSPASLRSTKLTPLTTRPSATSRQGMTRMRTVIDSSSRIRQPNGQGGVSTILLTVHHQKPLGLLERS
jgi:hypothetical protein